MKEAIISFNAGETTPLVHSRTDTAKYSSMCETMENMIPRIYGVAERRTGTEYIDGCYNNIVKSRVVDFEYSNTITYMIEFGNLIARFYYGDSVLLSGGVEVTVTTPYLAADLFELQFKQKNDVMWITHKDYPPMKLSRTSATAFSLEEIVFNDGPFLRRNDIENADDVTMTCDVTDIDDTGTLVASAATFQAGHVGALFKLTQPRVNVSSTGSRGATGIVCAAIDVEGTFTFNTHGTWAATVILERNENEYGWEVFRSFTRVSLDNIQLTATELVSNVQYRATVSAWTSGTIYCEITVNSSTQDGIVRVTDYHSTVLVDIEVVKALASTDAEYRWSEGAWSDVRGFPRTMTFFEDRSVYAGSIHEPQTLWFSASSIYEEFKEGVADNSSFSVAANADKRNAILWIASLENIVCGTNGGEWRVWSSSYGEPITSTNRSIKQQSSYGSKAIQAISVNDAVLFVDFIGRKLRELTYNADKEKYVCPDLTALAEHITESCITSMAYQRNPDPIIWCTRTDGVLLSFTYERIQDVVSWARHIIGGTEVTVESVAVKSGATEDEVWLTVKRRISGGFVRYIERIHARDFSTQEDCFFVDCGYTYDGAAATVISGLDHLEGETVSILGDGAVFPTQAVSSGDITLTEAVSKAHIGLPYTYNLKPVRPDYQSNQGSVMGSKVKIEGAVVSFYKTLNAKYTDGTDTYTPDWRSTEDYDAPPALFTGEKDDVVNFGIKANNPFTITGSDPLPCTVRSIVYKYTVTG